MSPLAQYVGLIGPAGRVVGLLALAAACAAAGGLLVGKVKDADVARLEARHAAAWAEAERSARERIQAAQRRGDQLTTDLQVANRAAMQIQEKLDDEIQRATAGRPCLGGDALRLLDRAPGIAPRPLPAAAGRAAAAHGAGPAADRPAPGPAGAPAADWAQGERSATDTDVALWARAAAGRYAECTRRLDALIDWHLTE